jgi:hypothetical protein
LAGAAYISAAVKDSVAPVVVLDTRASSAGTDLSPAILSLIRSAGRHPTECRMVRGIRKTGIPKAQVTAATLIAIQTVAIPIAADPTDWRNFQWVMAATLAVGCGRSRSQ